MDGCLYKSTRRMCYRMIFSITMRNDTFIYPFCMYVRTYMTTHVTTHIDVFDDSENT